MRPPYLKTEKAKNESGRGEKWSSSPHLSCRSYRVPTLSCPVILPQSGVNVYWALNHTLFVQKMTIRVRASELWGVVFYQQGCPQKLWMGLSREIFIAMCCY